MPDRASLAPAVPFLATLLLGALLGARLAAPQERPPADVLEVRGIRLVDETGRVRAELALRAGRGPGLWLLDEAGAERAALALDDRTPEDDPDPDFRAGPANDSAALVLSGPEGEPGIELALDTNPVHGGHPALRFLGGWSAGGDEPRPEVSLSGGSMARGPSLELCGFRGHRSVVLDTGQLGLRPGLVLRSPEGGADDPVGPQRAIYTGLEYGDGTTVLRASSPRGVVQLQLPADAPPRLEIRDAEGRATFTSD